VIVLANTMVDKDSPPGVKVQAASTILALSLRGVELEELKKRIDALEQHNTVPGEAASIETEATIVSDV
jgi:hypothetical protein